MHARMQGRPWAIRHTLVKVVAIVNIRRAVAGGAATSATSSAATDQAKELELPVKQTTTEIERA